MNRKIYLDNTPLQEAIEKWTNRLIGSGTYMPLQGEAVKVIDSLGRVTAEAIIAKISSPFYHSSAMDGYAVKFADTFGASEKTPKQLKIPESAQYVATGDPLPEGFNAVIMIEDVNIIRSQIMQKSCATGQADHPEKVPKSRDYGTSRVQIISPHPPLVKGGWKDLTIEHKIKYLNISR